MSSYLNYYGRNVDFGPLGLTLFGYTYLGPIPIPPIPTTVGMYDRAGTGVIWYLMWDGATHLQITNQPPLPFYVPNSQTAFSTTAQGQNTAVFGPWDGPYLGATGARLGVTTVGYSPTNPHLQFDFPTATSDVQEVSAGTSGPPIVAPYINGPQQQSYPEPTNYPTSGPPAIPGIPSTTPPPTGGGLAAFMAAYTTNTPPLVTVEFIPGNGPGTGWHIVTF